MRLASRLEMRPMADAPKRGLSIKWLFYLVLISAAGAGGLYTAHKLVVEPMTAERLRLLDELKQKDEENARLKKEKEELEGFVKNLERTERRANLWIDDQQTTPDGHITTICKFVELDKDGNPLRQAENISLDGDEIYVDALVLKHLDQHVKNGEPLKDKAVMIFRRLFSNKLKPDEGYALDVEGQAPLAYAAGHAPSDYEKGIWKDFWNIATDPNLRKKHDIRAAQGTAVYQKVKKGEYYLIELRSTGEVTMSNPAKGIQKVNAPAKTEAAPPAAKTD